MKSITIVKTRMNDRCGNSGGGSEVDSISCEAEVMNLVMTSAR